MPTNRIRMSWAVEIVEVHRHPLLRSVSFGAPAQGLTAIAGGPDGAGALLFRLIAGLDVPERGAVIVLGQDMSRASAAERKRLQRRLAVMFGGPELGLFATATVRENVTVAVRSAGRAGRRGERAIVEGALRSLDIAPLADALPGELGLAQRKRVALARALALRSPLLVADAFDHGSTAREVEALAALVREDSARRGAAALLVMADPELAAVVADEVVELAVPRDGRLAG
jgi:ABC-type transporter Mla maintaining outer membrane lipid asymmetry ATPase subunit MlaF